MKPPAKAEAVVTLAARPASARFLLDAVSSGSIPRDQVPAFQVRQMLGFSDDDVRHRVSKLWPETRAIATAKREQIDKLKAKLSPETLVISVAASVPTSYIEQHAGAKVPVVRAMPNTCSRVGSGMTGICAGAHASAAHLEIARAMFDAVGRTVVVDEKHMDAVTGLSASGPAFAYIILE